MLAEGEQVGDFRIGGLIGVGATAEVWCARHTSGRSVAFKVLRAMDAESQARFRAEARLLATLHHPGIVTLYDAGEVRGHPWMALELLDPLPEDAAEPQVRRWALQLCDAVDELHRQGVLHRDIKRANVLLRGRHAVLVDLGIAKPLNEAAAQSLFTLANPTLVGDAHAVGTLGASAPEQLTGAALTPAADVYALGVLIRDLLPDWQAYPLWRSVLARVLVADPALRLPTPRALGAAIARGHRRRWLGFAGRWLLPWVVAGCCLAWGPVREWSRLHGWEFARSGFYAKEQTALRPRTVYSTLVFTERVTEVALPDNPGGVVWLGAFSFACEAGPQRIILWSPTPESKVAIGNVYVGDCLDHEVVLVGDVDYHCTDLHGYVPFPTPTDGHLLGRPFDEAWVDHVRPVSGKQPIQIRRVATLAEARALPPPTPSMP